MYFDKLSETDGINPAFFQTYSNVAEDIIFMARRFFEDRVLPSGINATHVVLIPNKNSINVSELRPIANRLNNILQFIIYDTQSDLIV